MKKYGSNPKKNLSKEVTPKESSSYTPGSLTFNLSVGIIASLIASYIVENKLFGIIFSFIILVAIMAWGIYTKLTRDSQKHFLMPAKVFIWFLLFSVMTTVVLLISSIFFWWPMEIKTIFAQKPSALEIAYADTPPKPSEPFTKPLLQLEINAKRKGENNYSLLNDGEALASKTDNYIMVAHPLTHGYLYVFSGGFIRQNRLVIS